jgi:hypothetical protein
LVRLVYDLSERGGLMHGYWNKKKRRRKLEGMCKGLGIEGDVV